MSRAANLLLIVVCWAAIYLPGLGTLEIKGEEGRRILPAVTMLESGNWLVPQVGSEPYFRKPPLVNWLVALSFSLTGIRNEWTARLPSALSVLSVAMLFVTLTRGSLGPSGSLLGAFIWMVNLGIIEKGRLIEIEALYVSLFGIALICWLHWYYQKRSPWLTWTIPALFLGLGMLAKGPVHLLFYYSVVVAILYCEGDVRKLLHPAHFIGVMIVVGIFAAWAIPYWRVVGGADLAQTWSVQLTGRLTGDDFKFTHWLLNIPRALVYFLPWTLLLPLVPGAEFPSVRETNLHRGMMFGCAVPFLLINLLPGSLPRYALPVLVPASWLLAMTLAASRVQPPAWWPAPQVFASRDRAALTKLVVTGTSLLVGFGAVYLFLMVPSLQGRSKVKSVATKIDQIIPNSEPLYAVDPDYQPFLFYTKCRVEYVSQIEHLPLSARYVLIQPENEALLLGSKRWAPLRAKEIFRVTDYRDRTVIIAKISEGSE